MPAPGKSPETRPGIVGIAQDVAADAQDHASVPGHQRLERRLGGLAATGEESIQKLGVGEVRDHPDMWVQ